MADPKPTLEQFNRYQSAYDHFNRELFGDQLKPCLLVFREGRRVKNGIVLGHFAPERWSKGETTCHEISLNPEALSRGIEDAMGTLVHEMAHQWQQDHGTPPSGGYHDREWGKKMCEIGLIPSNTGEPGGKQTGRQMTHYVEPDGRFAQSFAKLTDEQKLPWTTGSVVLGPEGAKGAKEPKPKSRNKVKYNCRGCKANVWGKPRLKLTCTDCEESFSEANR